CLKKGVRSKLIGLKGEINQKIFQDIVYDSFRPYDISQIFDYLNKNNLTKIVIAGRVNRVNLSKLIFDKVGMKIFAEIIKTGFNDNNIYSIVIKFIEENGFKIISPNEIIDDILTQKGNMTNILIDEQMGVDIKKGIDILKGIICYDVGQALIIDQGLVLGVEAVEGTNELISRCANYRNSGGVLIKLCKPHQDKRVDLPCIGPDTIKNIAKYAYKGIVVEAKKSIILASKDTIGLANENKIFVYGV
ncbi:MAG: UDP-2,3-diacylglucosamine diphosphatase LpxI, partial [Proteobacteria bacterium]|nr:UDP-2,3-diacylglucosamine diphosphatase LpxI [Pseudomonadota bacterium]